MSAKLFSSAHVCLKCQLRLLRRSVAPVSSSTLLLRHQSRRRQHNDARDHPPFESLEDVSHKRQEDNFDEAEQSSELDNLDSSTIPLEPAKSGLSRRPLGRIHGKWGHNLVRESTESINAQSLGSPAEVLVLRDANFKYVPVRALNVEEEPIKSVDILEQIEAETGIVSEKEALKNIESLRPKGDVLGDGQRDSVVVDWEEFERLERMLRDGFTTHQLSKYVEFYRKQEEEVSQQVVKSTVSLTSSGLIRKTNWYAGLSPPETNSFDENPVRGYASVAYAPKQNLAVKILRNCWNVEVREVLESIGELELLLKKDEFKLLTNSTNTDAPLNILSNTYLSGQNEKIEAFRSRRVIRITTRKAQAETIATEIEELLSNIQSVDIDLESLQSSNEHGNREQDKFSDEDLSELSRLTSTYIQRISNRRLKVYSVGGAPENSFATPPDIVRRLLLTSSLITRPTTDVVVRHPFIPMRPIPVEASDVMPWRDRLQKWVRFSSPLRKTAVPQRKSRTLASRMQKEGASIFRKVLDKPTWLQDATRVPSITLGKVLHPASVTTFADHSISGSKAIFVPTTTYFSQLMRTISEPVEISSVAEALETSLLLKFVPSPWTPQGQSAMRIFPQLDVRLLINKNTKEPYLTQIRAVKEKTVLQLMMPERSLDMCLQQAAHIDLLEFQPLKALVYEFLGESQLNSNQSSLKTPSHLTLPIPLNLCDADHLGDSSETTHVRYLFAGLEHRTCVHFKFEQCDAQYTSIESGKADGRRAEVTLHPKTNLPGYDRTPFWQEEEYQGFINFAYHLVDMLDSWSDGLRKGRLSQGT